MEKICCIGTHGTGKTTLTYQLAAYFKTKGQNVKVVNETARSCPFPINLQFNAHGAMWIIHSLIKKELEAICRHATLVISDRAPIDTLMYAQATGCVVGQQMKNLFKLAEDWMDTYDKIYYIRPGESLAIPDGVRSTDENFRKKVEDNFDDWMEKCNMSIQNKTVIIKSEDIFSKTNCWVK
jgi:nicotinamide riboside kinase